MEIGLHLATPQLGYLIIEFARIYQKLKKSQYIKQYAILRIYFPPLSTKLIRKQSISEDRKFFLFQGP